MQNLVKKDPTGKNLNYLIVDNQIELFSDQLNRTFFEDIVVIVFVFVGKDSSRVVFLFRHRSYHRSYRRSFPIQSYWHFANKKELFCCIFLRKTV